MIPAEKEDRANRPSLSRNSAARFAADGAGLVLGVLASVITARWLGPSGKGLFASLLFLGGIVMQLSAFGLGDAAIVFIGQRKASLQESLSVTVCALICLSLVGMALFWVAALIAFHDDWEVVRVPAIIFTLGLPLAVANYALASFLNAQERIVASSAVLLVTALSTTIGLGLFVALLGLSLVGAALASTLGVAVGSGVVLVLLVFSQLSLRPRWDAAYLGAALRYGLPVQASWLLTNATMRADLFIVYALAGSSPAGQYSVALTVGSLAGLLPFAISYATFPRLANLDAGEAAILTARACRVGIVTATSATLALGASTPVLVPGLFGEEFRPAVAPSLILLCGSIPWSAQWLLCRAAAARGRPGLLVRSFTLSLLVMLILDYALVPRWGISGAALAAVLGPACGLTVALHAYARQEQWPLPLTALVPRKRDLEDLVRGVLRLVHEVGAALRSRTLKAHRTRN